VNPYGVAGLATSAAPAIHRRVQVDVAQGVPRGNLRERVDRRSRIPRIVAAELDVIGTRQRCEEIDAQRSLSGRSVVDRAILGPGQVFLVGAVTDSSPHGSSMSAIPFPDRERDPRGLERLAVRRDGRDAEGRQDDTRAVRSIAERMPTCLVPRGIRADPADHWFQDGPAST
jgi:hypothetical protein